MCCIEYLVSNMAVLISKPKQMAKMYHFLVFPSSIPLNRKRQIWAGSVRNTTVQQKVCFYMRIIFKVDFKNLCTLPKNK